MRRVLWAVGVLNLAMIVGDLVIFPGLLMLVSLLAVGALVISGRSLRRNSRLLTRWRMVQCRRHIEEMEVELGWRDPPQRPRVMPPQRIPGYAHIPAGAAVTASAYYHYPPRPITYTSGGGPGSGGLSLGKYIGLPYQ